MLGPNDKITKDKLTELFILTANGHLIWSTAPPMPESKIWWGSADAAANLAVRYGGKAVLAPPYYPAPMRGMVYSPAQMWFVLVDGIMVNAGELADMFVHYPEDVVPGAADRNNKQIIEWYKTYKG